VPTRARWRRSPKKIGAASDLSAAFARRHAELESAIAVGREWLGIGHDSLPDRMAFFRAAASHPLWLPPAVLTPLPMTKERKPISPTPATHRPVGQKAAVTFGNLADIGQALRAARKARREDMEQQAEAFGPPMFEL